MRVGIRRRSARELLRGVGVGLAVASSFGCDAVECDSKSADALVIVVHGGGEVAREQPIPAPSLGGAGGGGAGSASNYVLDSAQRCVAEVIVTRDGREQDVSCSAGSGMCRCSVARSGPGTYDVTVRLGNAEESADALVLLDACGDEITKRLEFFGE